LNFLEKIVIYLYRYRGFLSRLFLPWAQIQFGITLRDHF